MNVDWRPPRRWAIRNVPLWTLVFGLVAGCQTYERAPLDLIVHRDAVDDRWADFAPISAFAEWLRSADVDVPERFDPSDGVSSSEGEVLALFYNAELRLARLEAGVALAKAENAGLWQDPEFGFDGAEVFSAAAPFEFGLTLSLTIPVSGRLEVEKDRAGAAYEAELRRIVDAEWRTRAELRSAWAAWTAAEQRAQLLREVVARVERICSITERLETAGELNRVEGRLFRVELVNRRAALADAALRARQARIDLLGLMGLPPDATIELIPSFPISDVPADDGLDRLIESNTQLAVRRAEYRVAEESLRLEIRKQYPDLTIGSGYGREEGEDRLLLGLSVPIPILNANRAGIAEARAKRELARAAAETTFEHVARELAGAQAALDAARSQRTQYESEIVPMLAEQSAEIERIVELGEVDTFLLLETVNRQFNAKSRLLELRLAELTAQTTILQLLGPEASIDPAPVPSDSLNNATPAARHEAPERGAR